MTLRSNHLNPLFLVHRALTLRVAIAISTLCYYSTEHGYHYGHHYDHHVHVHAALVPVPTVTRTISTSTSTTRTQHKSNHDVTSSLFQLKLQATSSDQTNDYDDDRNNGNGLDIDMGINMDTSLQSGYDTTDGYERFLYTPRTQQKKQKQKENLYKKFRTTSRNNDDDEDGYNSMMRKYSDLPFWKKMIYKPIQITKSIIKGNMLNNQGEPGTLILVRHGESEWNANKTFTGWADANLSDQGIRETEHAARLLLAGGYDIDVVFTSRLKRAIRSTWIILTEINQLYLPVFKSWRLNERMYGALTGLCKKDTAMKFGESLVQSWRGSLTSRPPAVTSSDTYWPGRDRRYSDLSTDQIPLTESLLDCMNRTEPIWTNKIKWELQLGRNVMVVAHANTLRGLVKIIDNIGDEEIQDIAIPTGIPIIYKFDKYMNAIKPNSDKYLSQKHMNGIFLEKPGILNAALKKEKEWCATVPGYNRTMTRSNNAMSSLERSLTKLNAEKEFKEWAAQSIDLNDIEEDDGSDGNSGKGINFEEQDEVWEIGLEELREGEQFNPETKFHPVFSSSSSNGSSTTSNGSISNTNDEEEEELNEQVKPLLMTNNPCMQSMPSQSVIPGFGNVPIRRDPVVVLIRHGKTEHNKLGLFTGWEDAPLAREGKVEARQAGKLLKAHGFEFDVVYTSWLSRAIETAWLVMEEMDCTWLPIIKTWRLNERMYGALTGKSKAMVEQKYGAKQFKAWRRGYTVRPPKVSSFSVDYPGNDIRYKHLSDIRISISETIMRSFDSGNVSLYRKLPKAESLKDCMDRTIPYYTQQIAPQAINHGKRVLISSSENAIRGLLMTLCDIPEEKISELEIPNGIPIIYDLKSRCIKLLDDGSGEDPLEMYNFGNAASYLFRPCVNEDGEEEEECDITYTSDAVYSLSESDKEFARSLRL
mmetsp:Transcript_2822/g.3749  ORF Transcript_2822/g.3749 Transcript_2822/m.3749 type:complete len:928 (+) Transcript_2822:263-3046(+)